jgi:hypothetical protein
MATGLPASTDPLSEEEYHAAVSATADFLHEEEGDHLPPDLELGDLFDEQSLGETEEAQTPREPFATQGEYTIDFSYGDSTLKGQHPNLQPPPPLSPLCRTTSPVHAWMMLTAA